MAGTGASGGDILGQKKLGRGAPVPAWVHVVRAGASGGDIYGQKKMRGGASLPGRGARGGLAVWDGALYQFAA